MQAGGWGTRPGLKPWCEPSAVALFSLLWSWFQARGRARERLNLSLTRPYINDLRNSKIPALHNAVLDALRDAATEKAAADAIVFAGGVPLLAHVLKQNFTAMEGERRLLW